jgi:hypothetical protein
VFTTQKPDEIRSTFKNFFDLDDDTLIEVWDRRSVFRLDKPERDLWLKRGREANLPETYVLMVREGRDPVTELLWRPDPSISWEDCPIVGISRDGDTTVVAANVEDWLDALLYTAGQSSGGSEEDLEAAREEASREATRKTDELADEMDRELPDLEKLGERYERAQDKWCDLWGECAEDID